MSNILYPDLRVAHVFLGEPFMDNSGYQETLLAKYHKKICGDSFLIVSNLRYNKNDTVEWMKPCNYPDENGVEVIRINCFKDNLQRRIAYKDLLDTLIVRKPNVIMIHGCRIIFDIWAVITYKKKICNECFLIQDSHTAPDKFFYERMGLVSKTGLMINKLSNHMLSKHIDKIYGVTQGAKELMTCYFGFPSNRIDILPLGYDSDMINYAHKNQIKEDIRKRYGISQKSFLVVHGGKLTENKKTDILVSCMDKLPMNFQLVIFGGFQNEMYKQKVIESAGTRKMDVIYTGELSQKEIYDLYLASDMAVFPGGPSALRQQAVAAGLPIVIAINDGDPTINIVCNGNGIVLRSGWTPQDLVQDILTVYTSEEYRENANNLLKNEYKKYSYEYEAEYLISSI